MAYLQQLQEVLRLNSSANLMAQRVGKQFEEIRQEEETRAHIHREMIKQSQEYKANIQQQTEQLRDQSWQTRMDIAEALDEQKQFQTDLKREVEKAKGRYRHMKLRTVKVRRSERL